MSDNTTAEGTETGTADQETAEKVVDWQAEAEKWKALSRKNESEAKSLRPAAQKLAELEESQKTEVEKANARAAAAEKAAADAQLEAARSRIAVAKGLSASQAKRLVGTTVEELEADAEELVADLKIKAPGVTTSTEGQGKQGAAVGSGTKPGLNEALRVLAGN